MTGTYDAEYGLVVERSEKGKEFSPHLNFEPRFELDEQNRDALVVGLSRYERDSFLDQYYPLLGPLRHYVRVTT